jgi:hypothetical protein
MRNNSAYSKDIGGVRGYLHPHYAESLAEFGVPRKLPRCGGWILQRQIPCFPYDDAMGCYPLFVCKDWSQLHADLQSLGDELVSLSLVADPFGEYDLAYLQSCFDVVVPFKEHFIVDLHQPLNVMVSKHHRRYAAKSLQKVRVERCQDPLQFIDDWVHLYSTLIKRHSIEGIQAFSRTAFTKQLSIPGTVVFRAVHNGATVGADWYFLDGEAGYAHLSALSTEGYRVRASYALLWCAIEYFINNDLDNRKMRWLNLGSGAGVESNDTDGLSIWKRGWSTGTRTAYFCGRIFHHERYWTIAKAKGISATTYFPAYREGEFG